MQAGSWCHSTRSLMGHKALVGSRGELINILNQFGEGLVIILVASQ